MSTATMSTATMSRGAYARAAAIRIALFVAATVGYPFALTALIRSTNCSGIGGACGALALVVSFYVKPVIYLVFVLSMIRISVRRVRDIGLPAALAAVVPVLMLGDIMFGITYGAPWSLAFSLGAITSQIPRYLLMALMCIGFLCVARSSGDASGDDGQRWGKAGALAFGIVILSSLSALINLGREAALAVIQPGSIRLLSYVISYVSLWMSPVLLIAMFVLMARRQRRQGLAA